MNEIKITSITYALAMSITSVIFIIGESEYITEVILVQGFFGLFHILVLWHGEWKSNQDKNQQNKQQ